MQRLEVSGAVRPIYGSSGIKRLSMETKQVHRITRLKRWPLWIDEDRPTIPQKQDPARQA